MTSTGSSSSAGATDAASAAAAGPDAGSGKPRTDLAIGLATYNSTARIGPVTAACRAVLDNLSAGTTAAIIIADGGSTDGTLDLARRNLGEAVPLVPVAYTLHAHDLLNMPYHGVPARTRGVARILEEARGLGARACVIVDPAAFSPDPGCITGLVQPVLAGTADFVSTFQLRRPYSGAIVKGVIAPLFRSLYGVRLRHPVADTFACSAALIEHYLEDADGPTDGVLPALDLHLPATAVCNGFQVAEAVVGCRLEDGRDAPDVSVVLAQAAGSLFHEVGRRPDAWQKVRRSVAVPVFGDPPPIEAGRSSVDVERLVDSFRLGYRELRDVWTLVLPPRTILELKKVAEAPLDRFRVDDVVWAQVVYDFAVGYHVRLIRREHLLRSLTPLYVGWFASFILQVRDATPEEVDERLERLSETFEQQKPYFLSRWRWPERGKAMS